MYKCIADVYYSLCCCCICFLGGWARRRDDWERRLNHARGRDVPILHRGIETHDMASVRQLVKRQKTRADQKKLVNTCLVYGGGTALHVACRKTATGAATTAAATAATAKTSSKTTSAVDMVRYLVHTCGADVEGTDEPHQCTALHVALQHNDIDLAQYLVKRCRANVNAQDKLGQTCLHYACRYGTIALVRYILPECVRQTAHTLHVDKAVATSRVLEARDTGGHAALHMACLQDSDSSNSLEIARYLVEMGSASMVHDVDKEGMTPLHHACFTGGQSSTELVQFLVDIGHEKDKNGLIEKADHHGNTALHWACASAKINLETVRHLVETIGRATTEGEETDGAAETRQVAFLLCVNQEGQTALHKAAVTVASASDSALIYLDAIQYLVQAGVDANATDANGCTALDGLKATLRKSKNHTQHRDDACVKNVLEYLESVTTSTSYTARLWNYLAPSSSSSSSSPKPRLTASESSDTSPV